MDQNRAKSIEDRAAAAASRVWGSVHGGNAPFTPQRGRPPEQQSTSAGRTPFAQPESCTPPPDSRDGEIRRLNKLLTERDTQLVQVKEELRDAIVSIAQRDETIEALQIQVSQLRSAPSPRRRSASPRRVGWIETPAAAATSGSELSRQSLSRSASRMLHHADFKSPRPAGTSPSGSQPAAEDLPAPEFGPQLPAEAAADFLLLSRLRGSAMEDAEAQMEAAHVENTARRRASASAGSQQVASANIHVEDDSHAPAAAFNGKVAEQASSGDGDGDDGIIGGDVWTVLSWLRSLPKLLELIRFHLLSPLLIDGGGIRGDRGDGGSASGESDSSDDHDVDFADANPVERSRLELGLVRAYGRENGHEAVLEMLRRPMAQYGGSRHGGVAGGIVDGEGLLSAIARHVHMEARSLRDLGASSTADFESKCATGCRSFLVRSFLLPPPGYVSNFPRAPAARSRASCQLVPLARSKPAATAQVSARLPRALLRHARHLFHGPRGPHWSAKSKFARGNGARALRLKRQPARLLDAELRSHDHERDRVVVRLQP